MKNRFEAVFSVSLSVILVAATFFGSDMLSSFAGSLYSYAFNAAGQVMRFNGEYSGDIAEVGGMNALCDYADAAFASQSAHAVPDDVMAVMAKARSTYARLSKSGEISEETFTKASANNVYGDVALSNKTDSHKVNLKSLLQKKASLGKLKKSNPTVLIYHTHATEGFELLDTGWYSEDYNSRTENISKSVVRVGTEIENALRDAGWTVIHDTEIYDTTYNGAYSRSLKGVERILKENPSIIVTLDVHRDAIHYSDGTKCKPTAVVDGRKAAQVMIITGCEEGSVEDFPRWEENLIFSLALQKKAAELYPDLMRPIFFCQRKYNMNVTPCSVLLEFGTDANTLDEAVYSGRLIGEVLSDVLGDYL